MKQLISLLSSLKTMLVLMAIFAFAIGYATFVENDYGTITSKAEIYNATWFEILLGLLALNLAINIYTKKMFTLAKAPIFIFHSAFLIILVGAAITRYVGFEGMMHIREGSSSNIIVSSEAFFSVDAKSNGEKSEYSKSIYLSKKSSNTLSATLEINDKELNVALIEYIPDAIETNVADESGSPVAELMVTGGGKGKPLSLKYGEYYEDANLVLDFGSMLTFHKPVISIFVKENELFMSHNMSIKYLKMDDSTTGELKENKEEPFARRTLFTVASTNFVLKSFIPHAVSKVVSNPQAKANRAGMDALRFKVSVGEEAKEVLVFGMGGRLAQPVHVDIAGMHVNVSYGSKEIIIPFKIHLKDFQLDRYPGSMSPASYASEVVLVDEEEGINMPYRIYMNNILNHRGYKFFQSSYDQDEKGTVLSVNNDPGTLPSYLGYLLLAIGMYWSLFSKKHRFAKLNEKAKKASMKKALPALLAVGLMFSVTPSHAEDLNPAIKTILAFDKAHAKKFGALIVQDTQGRMKPLNTLATEVLAKIHRSATFSVANQTLDPNQVFLGMMIRPDIYRDVKLIRTKDEAVNKLVGVHADAKYVAFSKFFEDPVSMRGYRLSSAVEDAIRKAPKHRNKFDKAVLKVDEKVNIAYMVFTGALTNIWPKENDVNNKWFATIDALQTFNPKNSEILRILAVDYFTSIDKALSSHDWSVPDAALAKIALHQKKYGAAVYPTKNRIDAEVLYNEAHIFETIYPVYLLFGFILLVLSFVKILKPKFNIALFSKISLGILIILFLAHTFGLALRWYISDHAPWSNGYESMLFIGWASVLAGFIFSKRSSMTLAATGILTGLILFVAHLNWMDPQVTNLVPVLNSYWLSIHVSMITSSYGFLGLSALLGFLTIILFILKTPNNEKHISLSIKELNSINEMSIMVGLVLLTIGNFLGGVWANESWGRYWGWDPKETWALVTILIYAMVLHMRFVKSFYNDFNFSVISLLSFTSVLMTYFGVNYYLAGMHSYAKGDPVPVPDFVPITYLIVFLVIALAFRNRKLA
ncbi:cytochrome c biogenesis protein CcsA [Sulfurimonas sp. SAG-AH-194-I05]|nr:cytochrome c biogenesis protein CcsA [Sulfurimonas sp. SAG-AH-194-I05]MDF1875561.1 cytochrome c biogenesis protein CcsA [Sulfurimonas sp. SAG-AH-194-I05]